MYRKASPLLPEESNDFQKNGIWAGFLENTAQYPLMREMKSESSPSGFPRSV